MDYSFIFIVIIFFLMCFCLLEVTDMEYVYPEWKKGASLEEFINIYQKYYYLKNDFEQEKTIIKYLEKNDALSEKEISVILSWKAGKDLDEIDYTYLTGLVNQFKNEIRKSKYDFETYKKWVVKLQKAHNCIGKTYATTLMYFASNGTYPIYDQFAAKALDRLIGEEKYKDYILDSYSKYNRYVGIITSEFKDIYDARIENIEEWRAVDQALWAYGHLKVDEIISKFSI